MAQRKRGRKPISTRRAPKGSPPAARRRRVVPTAGAATAPFAGDGGPTVVGVGASAGGLEAFTQLLEALPEGTDLALVFVQHLAPQHESALPALLGAKTRIPVEQVRDGMRIAPGRVYVIPPNVQMGITDGVLHLAPRPGDRSQYTPVDFFLRSLSRTAKNRAIAVILSGTASDGALGVREVKAVGGVTIAQDPQTARYDGMPRAAISTGMIDLVLPPGAIAAELMRIAEHPYLRAAWPRKPGADLLPVNDDELDRLFGLLQATSGVDFRHYKLPTIKRRIQRRMALNRTAGFDQYLKYLREHPPEVKLLYQDILIHVTRFFREPESFATLAKHVFPALLEKRGDEPIRAWVPGCSTGEEAYSVAMALAEHLAAEKRSGLPVQVFGTDVSDSAIDFARAGVYPESIAADVSPERLRRFFTKLDHSYRIARSVRDACIFARQDVTRDPPFSRMDLILCRNVLIYMNSVLQQRLMGIFHYALKPKGFLMLGHAETIGPYAESFEMKNKHHRVYRKKAASLPPRMGYAVPHRAGGGGPVPPPTTERAAGPTLHHEVDRLLLERFSPPGVVVDAADQILQFRGQTGPYLQPAPGDASLNLLRMLREGLVFAMRKALAEARQRKMPVRKAGLRLRTDDGSRPVDVEVVPLAHAGKRHAVVLFHEVRRRTVGAIGPRKAGARRGTNGATVARMEQELAASREYMQSIIQELEAANEELQSANEEVLSSNEELQSTNEELDTAKEELQSTNEELNTVNEELSRVNSDLVNLLASVQIAIVILAADLRIRRFTPMAEKILNLIPADVGRPIGNIKPGFDCPDLEKLCATVIDDMTVVEREVRDGNGKPYSLRIRPYKNLENRIDGAVLTLFDIAHPAGGPEDAPPAQG